LIIHWLGRTPGGKKDGADHLGTEEQLARADASESESSLWWWLAVAAGIALRAAVVVIPGNQLRSPWGGGGDAPSYVLLAKNLFEGRGFTYASIPSAFRPPLYPIFLACLMKLFGTHWLIAVRYVQFLLGLGTVYLVYRISRTLFGPEAGRAGLLVGLFLPTLIYTTSEVLTECLSSFFVATFLLLMLRQFFKGDWKNSAGLGITTSLAALTHFDLAALIAPAAWATLGRRHGTAQARKLALVCLFSLAAVSPWIVRNWIVFGGQLVYGTDSGYAALEGVLSPSGRAQHRQIQQQEISGWLMYQLETNSQARLALPAEPQLNRRDWRLTLHLWRVEGWHMLPILVRKLGYFWLSTDQLLATTHFGSWTRIGRACGVLAYWAALLLAFGGFLYLWRERRDVAWLLGFYVILLTLVHFPFAMNTRLRLPNMDPLVAALAAGGWMRAKTLWSTQRHTGHQVSVQV
jgi:4-amino-4-deoxy-L-arabinose transferase-like glycosyltransferase